MTSDRPIFFVGMMRSGTTLMLEAFAARSDLAWFSRALNRVPWLPSICAVERLAHVHPAFRSTIYQSDQIGPGLRRLRRLERLRLGPTEGQNVWRHWAGEKFMGSFMHQSEATKPERQRLRALVHKVTRYEGKPRLVAKLTGPTRIRYLSSVFPDAFFVHVIRDGRAVAHSLQHHPGWRNTFRWHRPAWDGLSDEHLEGWREIGQPPLGLAAIEWRAVIESAREEAAGLAPHRYREIRYEDFLSDPHRKLDEVTKMCDLPPSHEIHTFLDRRIRLRDMNYQWRESLDSADVSMLEHLIGDTLSELGYRSFSRALASRAVR